MSMAYGILIQSTLHSHQVGTKKSITPITTTTE